MKDYTDLWWSWRKWEVKPRQPVWFNRYAWGKSPSGCYGKIVKWWQWSDYLSNNNGYLNTMKTQDGSGCKTHYTLWQPSFDKMMMAELGDFKY